MDFYNLWQEYIIYYEQLLFIGMPVFDLLQRKSVERSCYQDHYGGVQFNHLVT